MTAADRESEAILTEGLTGLLPGGRLVGEEACALDASLLEGLGHGLV